MTLATKQDPSSLVKALEWRYATKVFDPTKKISDQDIKALEQALVLSPSSYGLQPWKFIVVHDPSLKEKLFEHAWKQAQVKDCSHYVVLSRLKKLSEADVDRFIGRTAEVQGREPASLAGYKKIIVGDLVNGPRSKIIEHWATYQTYLALGVLLSSAATLGIDACPMEGIVPPKFDEVLGLDSTPYGTVVGCALGYRADSDKYGSLPKVRYKLDEVVERR